MSRRIVWRGLALVVLLALASFFVFLSESDFFLASGSDSGVTIYAPALNAKLLALALVVAGSTAGLFATRLAPAARVLLLTLPWLTLALATHAVVFNHKRGVLEEFWLLASVDRARYDVADGVGVDWTVHEGPFGFRLVHKSDARSVYVFCGMPPWHVDPRASLR